MPRKPTYHAERSEPNGATLGFKAKLWQAADKMRNNMDAAEYKHVVLGLIFLKYISDAFEERHAQIERGTADPASEWYVKDPQARYAVMEDRDEYLPGPPISSGCPRRHAGRTCRPTPSSRPSASCSTMPWWPSSATTRCSRACCPRTTPARRWTSSAWAS
jgi:hypothetical protein